MLVKVDLRDAAFVQPDMEFDAGRWLDAVDFPIDVAEHIQFKDQQFEALRRERPSMGIAIRRFRVHACFVIGSLGVAQRIAETERSSLSQML